MLNRKVIQGLVLSASALLGTPSFALAAAPTPSTAPCVLHQHRVASVKPLRVTESMYGRWTRERLTGAELFVVAEPGLTAEWLQLTIGQHIAEMKTTPGMPGCPLGVQDVAVQVKSGGAGFVVRLTAPDAAKADEILRRAQLLAS